MPKDSRKLKITQVFPSRTKTRREWTWILYSSNGRPQAQCPNFFPKRAQAVKAALTAVRSFRTPVIMEKYKDGVLESAVELALDSDLMEVT